MKDESKTCLTEAFAQYFKLELAVSEAQKKEVFRIRHRVYCEEFKYQAVDPSGNGLETDEFDGAVEQIYERAAVLKNVSPYILKIEVWNNFNRIENSLISRF